jgi:hypothetical protein
MTAHPQRTRLILDMHRVWPGLPRGRGADPFAFLATSELLEMLVEHRPDVWGTISDGRPLSSQLLAAILRSDGGPDLARPIRVDGRKGRTRAQLRALLDSVPPETAKTSFTRPGPDGILVEFGPGMLELLEVGGLCTILPIVHRFPGDRALITAYLVTPVDSGGTLTA